MSRMSRTSLHASYFVSRVVAGPFVSGVRKNVSSAGPTHAEAVVKFKDALRRGLVRAVRKSE